jgi:hypothetical protein
MQQMNSDLKEQNFGFYLARLFEADGHITLQGPKYRNAAAFHITFHNTQLPLAQTLVNTIGHGWIRHKI